MLRIRQILLMTAATSCLALISCAPPEPIRIGFLGGLSGRVTDLGMGGRNGVRLAVELRNKAGGINGLQIELIEMDDQQDPELARQAVQHLIDHNVFAIVGPMTSAMAISTVPLVNQAKLPMVSPTVTTNELSGLDDYFFRVIPPTREFVRTSSQYYRNERGLRRIRLVFDLRNRSYTESWLNDFTAAFAKAGGELLEPVAFSSSDELNFSNLASQALKEAPDAVLILGNSVDAAMLCQKIRQINPAISIGTSEWAATERLIELGDQAVEGITVAQFIDRFSQAPSYVAFRNAYRKRFNLEPGFPGLLAFDASNVIFEALAKKTSDQSLKQALLSQQSFAGTQKPIKFDANGDTLGETFMMTVKNRAFVPVIDTRP